MTQGYKKKILAFIGMFLVLLMFTTNAQAPCMPTVPSYTVNLTGSPAGVWTSPNVSRNDQCCGVQAPNQCIYFYLTLDPNAAGIQIDMIGADPAGSLFYNIGCTGNYPGGTIKCINGVGPHQITFCKPGGNANIYKITSISKPLFPKDDTVRLGCKHKFVTLGIVNNSVSWQSIYPGTPGQYNSFLDSTNVASPTYSPSGVVPPYIDYKVCGFPIASGCGYSLTVCDTIRVYNFPKLTASVTPNPATFCNAGAGSGVSLTASATGGAPSYSYTWKNSASVTVGTGASYYATAAGNYNVEVKDILYDPLECPAASTIVSVSQGTVPTVDAGSNQKKCASSPLATLNGSVQFATGGLWTGGAGTYTPGNNYLNTAYMPSASELSAGFVKLYLTTTGAGGSCSNKTDSVYIYYAQPLNVSIPSASIACYNGTTTLNSNVTGGTLPYAYLWNTGSTNPSINAGQGNFSLIVTDSMGCTNSANVNLVTPPALNLSFNVSNVTVNGGNDGSATVTPTGGTSAYTVIWTPGNLNSFSINNLVYGVYTATVTDANGCKITGSKVVNEPRCLGFTSVASATNVSCNNANNGVATVTVTGGTPAYSYTWNTIPVQTGSTAVNLDANVYSVIIQDANSCFQTANVTITEPTQLTDVMTHTNVTIIGGNNGAAAANAFGGTTPYAYLWNTSAITSSISGLTAGTYSVTITDNAGCSKSDFVTITQPPCNGLTLNLFKNNVSCFGGSNGSALAVVSGATGSYTISWSNGSTGPSVANLSAGNYSVMVTNSSNCSEYVNFTITQPSQLSIGLMPVHVSCNGSANGSIDLSISGGTFPYSYSWNNNSNQEDLAYLSPGNYSVAITDANGCQAIGSAVITQPPAFNVTYNTQNVSCIYGTNGAIGLNVSGGTAPFTYTWSTGATTQSVAGLTAGGYTVAIKDANNCTLNQPLLIPLTQPDSVKVDSFIVSCSIPGSNQTLVNVIPTGGTSGSYEVSFNNGTTFQAPGAYTALLNNSNTYSVVIKDVNNCVSLATQTLAIPAEVKIDSVNFVKCYAAGTTSTNVILYPSGGSTGLYSSSFNNGGSYLSQGTYSASLPIGTSYTLIVKDNRGCVSASSVITVPSVLCATSSVTSNYNGQNISCFGLANGSAMVNAAGGTGAYTYTWSVTPSQNTANATNLLAGTYSVIVADINNCSITSTVTLTEPVLLTSTVTATSNYNGLNISCNGLTDGSASVTVAGGTAPLSYNWNSIPSQTTAMAINLAAGVYSVTVTDLNGCAVLNAVTLMQPAAISATTAVTSNYNGQDISCFGLSDATATVTTLGGNGTYTYSWSTTPTQTTATASNLSAGNYSVIVTDINNCSVTKTITIGQPASLAASATITSNYNGQNISCFGLSDGSVTAIANGGTGAYTYTWNTVPSQTTASANNLSAGIYSVNIMDANGCTSSTSITLNQPAAVVPTVASLSNFNGYNVSCFGSNNGYADISLTGGTGAYTYSWSNGASSQDINSLAAGNYSVVVTDVNGCTGTLSVNISQPPQLILAIDSLSNFNGYNIQCNGLSNGTVYASVNGGVAAYSYLWSNGSNNQNLGNAGAGGYTLTVLDQNNCTSVITTTLSEPSDIGISVAVTSPLCNGVANGAIDVTTNGGVNPFVYSWSNGATTEDISNITAGTYTVYYTDKNNCKDSSAIIVIQPQLFTLNKNINTIKCYGDTIGSIILSLNGGVLPYTYQWSNATSASSLTNLSAGIYTVTVTDANGCFLKDTTILSQPDSLQLSLSSPLQFDGHNISYPGGNDGSVMLVATGGVLPYTYLWSNSSTDQNLYNVNAGLYSVSLVDNNGCRISGTITLSEPLVLEMPSGFSPNNDGKNDLFVVHGIEAYPQNSLTIFNRWGNIVYEKSGYNNEWSGQSKNGMQLPDATYFVILEINAGEKVLKGYVELRR
jgi:gliding motility-associated-like protein